MASTTNVQNQTTPTPERLNQIAWGYALPLIIEAALRTKIFDLLDTGARSAEQIAKETGTSLRGARILLNALVGVDLARKEGDRYILSPESATYLVASKPTYQGGLFKHVSQHLVPKWLHLEEIVRTGRPQKPVNQEDTGESFFAEFVEDIFPMSYPATQVLGAALQLEKATGPIKVLDIAAGSGVWGIGLAQKSTQVKVTAVDWPAVLDVTRKLVKRFELTSRFEFVAGDMHTANFGSGHYIATLGHILHSDGAQKSKALIRKVFNALAPGGTIVISEFVANDDRTGPANALIFAVNMLVNTDEGDTFTFAEIRAWLHEAGFKDVRQLEAPAPSPLILATKP